MGLIYRSKFVLVSRRLIFVGAYIQEAYIRDLTINSSDRAVINLKFGR